MNKTTDGQTAIDITALAQTADGWTVDSELGGVVRVEVQNHYNSSGILWVNNEERYSSAGLYTSDTLMVHEVSVDAGDTVRAQNMTSVWFTPYRAIV